MPEAGRQYRVSVLDLESVNASFGLLADRLDEFEGRRGTTTIWNTLNLSGNLLPLADDTYDIGSTTLGWQNLYLTGLLYFDDTNSLTHDGTDFVLNDSLKVNADILIDAGSITSISGAIDFNNEDLSTSGNLTLSSLSEGSVLFAGSGGLISENNDNLFWNDTDKRLGIGTSSPAETLDVRGDIVVNNDVHIKADNKRLYFGAGDDVSIEYDPDYKDALDFYIGATRVGRFYGDRFGINTQYPQASIHAQTTTGFHPSLVSLGDSLFALLQSSDDTGKERTAFMAVADNTNKNKPSVMGFNAFAYAGGSGTITDLIVGRYQPKLYQKTGGGGTLGGGTITNATAIEVGALDTYGSPDLNVGTARGIYIKNPDLVITSGTITDWIGMDIEGLTTETVSGSIYGIRVKDDTYDYEIMLEDDGEIFFRDSAIHIGSLTDGHLDLTADTSIDANNIIQCTTGDGSSRVFEFSADATDPTGGGGAATGRIPVLIGGVTRYLAYY